MSSLLPAADDGLELYAAHVAELLLELRDESFVLSSLDQHLIETWWDAGYPLESVLATVRTQGPRLKKRKKPPRGLPLTSMKKAVQKAGDRALVANVGHHGAPDDDNPDVLRPLRRDLLAALENANERGPLRLALAEVEELLAAPPGSEELYSALLGVGRRYYAASLAALQPEPRALLREAALAELPDASRQLPAEALEDTAQQLSIRRLRADDPLFDPARFWTAP